MEGVQVLVGVVQHRAEVGHHVGQAAVNCVNPPGEGSGELAGGLPGGGGGLRLNEVDDRLGLGQVQFSVEEGPLGELPGPGLPGAGSEEGVQDQREDHGGAVALKLRRLLPGVAVGSPADKGQAGVKRLARLVQQGAVEELTVRRVRQGAGSLRAEDPGRCLGGPGAGQPQNPHPPCPGGSGDGGNEIRHGGPPFQETIFGESTVKMFLDSIFRQPKMHVREYTPIVDNSVDNV